MLPLQILAPSVLLLWSVLAIPSLHAQHTVHIVGAMKNVMWKGQLEGSIDLDTLDREHLYGLGPIEYLRGEIMILDGRCFLSRVAPDGSIVMEESFAVKAPFLGYGRLARWSEQALPDSVLTMEDLERHLDRITRTLPRPFLFRLKGSVQEARIHIMNLPPGRPVHSPEDAHSTQVNYDIHEEEAEILGFFSQRHQTIFTHHDTWLHLHLMTADGQRMGHLDTVRFQPESMTLFLPSE